MKRLNDKPYSRISIPANICGIYGIVNNLDNKIYVGSSKSCRKRLGVHLSLLRYNKHHSPHLQHAFNRDLIENFSFVVLEDVPAIVSKLKEREQYWINFYDAANPDKGYNVAKYAEHPALGGTSWNKDNWKTKVTVEQLVEDYKSGLFLTDLEVKYQLSDTTISNILKANGIVPKKLGRAKGRECPKNIIDSLEKFYKEGHTVRECVKKFHIPQTTVRGYLADRDCLRNNHFSPKQEAKLNKIVVPLFYDGFDIHTCYQKTGIDKRTITRFLIRQGLLEKQG